MHQGFEPIDLGLAFTAFRFKNAPTAGGVDGEHEGNITQLLGTFTLTLPWEKLKNKAELPPTVDQSRLEDYLDDAEFLKAFGCGREEWQKRPQWRRIDEKKKAGLY